MGLLGTRNNYSGGQSEGTSGGTPGGSDTQIQFNDGGVFGSSPNLAWDGLALKLGANRHIDYASNAYINFGTAWNTNGLYIRNHVTTIVQIKAGGTRFNHSLSVGTGEEPDVHNRFDVRSPYDSSGQNVARFRNINNVELFKTSSNGATSIRSAGPTVTPLTIQGAVAQTGNVQEWQDSAGNILLGLKGDGVLYSEDSTIDMEGGLSLTDATAAIGTKMIRKQGSGVCIINTGLSLDAVRYFNAELSFFRYSSHAAGSRPGKIYISGLMYNTGTVFNPTASIIGNYAGTPTVRVGKDSNNKMVFIVGDVDDTTTMHIMFDNIKIGRNEAIDTSLITMAWGTSISGYSSLTTLADCNISNAGVTVLGAAAANSAIYPLKLHNKGGGLNDKVGISLSAGFGQTSDLSESKSSQILLNRNNINPYLSIGVSGDNATPPEQFFFTSAGKFGIGTSTPDKTLHIQANNNVIARFERTGPAQSAYISFQNPAHNATDNDGCIIGMDGNSEGIWFNYENKGLRLGTNGSDKLKILGNGNVFVNGFGSSVVGMSVRGAPSQSANLQEWEDSSGAVLAAITGTGKVGIGTGTPVAPLHIDTSAADMAYFARNGSTRITFEASGNNGAMGYRGSLGNEYILGANGNDFHIWDGSYMGNGSNRLAITSQGKVGFGTTSPSGQMEVRITTPSFIGSVVRAAASQTANLQEWQDSTGTAKSHVDSSGNFVMPNLPTSDPATAGALWNDSGTLKVSAG